jgi:pimeloyl-ACP methyl ester carboxylesterase
MVCNVEDVSFESFVGDLEAVVDAAGLKRFALFGISQGCAVSIAYAVRHAERVTHLILFGGYAVGWAKRARSAAEKEQAAAMLTLVRLGWGQENPAFRQLFTSQFIPGGTKAQADWFNELQRVSTSAEDAVRNLIANGDTDVSALLAQVTVPTLVMHSRDDARVPFDQGRRLAAGIPGARFVSLPSSNHLILEDEPAFPRFLEEMRAFLTH